MCFSGISYLLKKKTDQGLKPILESKANLQRHYLNSNFENTYTKATKCRLLYSNTAGVIIALVSQFLAQFPLRREAIVRTLSVCPSQLLVFRGLTD